MNELFEALRECNYWAGDAPDTGWPRTDYLQRIEEFLGNRLTKVLIGQRRSGKSVLLRQIMVALMKNGVPAKNICYVDKERASFGDLVEGRQLHRLIGEYRKRLKVRGKVYLFLDEVQEIEGWERVVNACSQNSRQSYEVFVTGSNSQMLSTELGTLLTGRYVPFEVFPFSFAEYAGATKSAKDKVTLMAYLRHGGLPELFHLTTEEVRRHYVTTLRDAILMNDVVRRHRIKDPDLLDRLFRYICENVGTMVSINKLVGYLRSRGQKTNYETVAAYLSYLQQAMLVHACGRYDIRGKELLAGDRKYYLNDLAFREHLASGFEPGLTRRLENLFYLHFRSRGCAVYAGVSRNLEIDFVVENNRQRAYYQVSYLLTGPDVIEREFRGLEKIKDHYPKTVISLDDVVMGERNGIAHRQAWDILGG